MKAELLPLDGKHYGSIIRITDGSFTTEITVWHNADFTPSVRELESWGYTEDDWEKNRNVDDGFGGKSPVRSLDITSDGHFESAWQYNLCRRIIDAINAS